jgi:hypothetical protein
MKNKTIISYEGLNNSYYQNIVTVTKSGRSWMGGTCETYVTGKKLI